MYYRIKKIVYDTLINEDSRTLAKRIFFGFIIILILLYALLFVISTVGELLTKYYKIFIGFEAFVIIVFTIEYILKIWSCNVDNRFKGRFKGRLKYAMSPLMIIDFIAIFPFYLVLLTPIGIKFLRLGRLLRLFHIFRYGFFNKSINILTGAIKKRSRELIITLMVILVLIFFCAFIIYSAEHEAQPDVYSSVSKSIYWASVTLTTVGYGDMTPVTPFGRFFTAIASFLGIGLIAIPAGIISSGMIEVVKEMKREEEKQKCPHCGKVIDSE